MTAETFGVTKIRIRVSFLKGWAKGCLKKTDKLTEKRESLN
jgi:hypothetical protein